MKSIKLLKVASLGLLASGMLLSEPVSAGSNGQMLKVNIGSGSGTVKIGGYNQNNQWRNWSSGGAGTVYTNGWWWKGYVQVSVHKDQAPPWWMWWAKQDKVCTFTIPQSQWGDWYTIDCQP